MWKNVKFIRNNKISCLYNIENVNVFLRWENCRQPSAGIRTGSCGFCPILRLCYQREANPLSIWFSDKGCSANCQRNFYYLVVGIGLKILEKLKQKCFIFSRWTTFLSPTPILMAFTGVTNASRWTTYQNSLMCCNSVTQKHYPHR